MNKSEYGKTALKNQLFFKFLIILSMIFYLKKNGNKVLLSEINNNLQIVILFILGGFILYTLVAGKISELPDDTYYPILTFVYIYTILYIFVLFLNILNFIPQTSNVHSMLILLIFICSLGFSLFDVFDYKPKKNFLIDLVIKDPIYDNKSKINKFNMFLDICLTFIYVFFIVNVVISKI